MADWGSGRAFLRTWAAVTDGEIAICSRGTLVIRIASGMAWNGTQ